MTHHTYDALQDAWSSATCYGCGPANEHGLRIKSYWNSDESAVIATFHPQPYHNAGFPNVMYGGLVASLIDCHSIWTAIAYTYRAEGRPHGDLPAVSYVTGKLEVNYHKPTPLDQPILLSATVEKLEGRKAVVHCTLGYGDVITAVANVLAIRIQEDKSKGILG
jgi:acyl-coenzyme A thioesterase PaaI-like protein